jgi:hypothetical protein
MSIFDPTTFAQMTFQDANSTETVPLPVGEQLMDIEKSEIKAWQKKDDPSTGGLKCILTLKTEDPEIANLTGRKINRVVYEMMLDLTPTGGLDFGKGMNVRLGRAREACGLNRPGVPFGFDMFIGHQVKANITHELYQQALQARCTAITKP